jgi:glycerate kinase
MKVVAAIDSFKGSLSSKQAGEAARAGVLRADPAAEVDVVEVADGGEGTLAALVRAHVGDMVDVAACDALNRARQAQIGVFEREGQRLAIVESARTVGIDLVTVDESLPRLGNSYGLGMQLTGAVDRGVDEMLVTLGGSATTDGGTGMFLALGAEILDAAGNRIGRDENPLWRFARLDVSRMRDLSAATVTVLSDVTNPLPGPRGAARVFGPQKGATPEQVRHLDRQLWLWAAALRESWGRDVSDVPGAGAAGGLGAALLALGGHLEPGFGRVAAEIDLASRLEGADLVLTGEGCLDSQSAYGKVPSGVAALARGAGALVVGIAGRVDRPLGDISSLLDGAFAIHSEPRTRSEALDPTVTAAEIQETAFEVTRLVAAARGRGPRD